MLKRVSHVWTSEDEVKLREMAAKGVYLRNIAIRLRRSESSIKKRAFDLGLSLRRTPRSHFRIDELTW
jgi:hypothetical protein